ncbi:hypothetical protein GN956_G928 [Arapaima gigas]
MSAASVGCCSGRRLLCCSRLGVQLQPRQQHRSACRKKMRAALPFSLKHASLRQNRARAKATRPNVLTLRKVKLEGEQKLQGEEEPTCRTGTSEHLENKSDGMKTWWPVLVRWNYTGVVSL